MHAVGVKTHNGSHKYTHAQTHLHKMFNHSIVVVVENLIYILVYAYTTVLQVVGLKLLL